MTPAELVDRAGELGSLPDTWQRVDAVLGRDAATTAQIAEAIASDPALSARLLRLANSPLFGTAQRVDRLSQAVHLVGTRQLRDLALAATVLDRFASAPGDIEAVRGLTVHSLATGLLARTIAGRRREANVERFFVAGLLHDLGMLLLLLQAHDDERAALDRAATAGLPIEVAERERFGWDHAQVGGLLVERWRLPAQLADPVAWHHAPGRAPAHRVEAAVLHIASTGADLLGFGGEGGVATPLDPAAWELVGLPADDIAAVADDAAAQLAPVAEILLGRAA